MKWNAHKAMSVQERKMEMEDERMKKEDLSALMSELHNDIDELKEMQSRLRENKADSDSIFAITKAKWQIQDDRDKHLAEFRRGAKE